MNLEKYLIPENATESLDAEAKATLLVGGVTAGLIGVGILGSKIKKMIANAKKRPRSSNSSSSTSSSYKEKVYGPTYPVGESAESMNQKLREINPKAVEDEMKARHKFFTEYRAFIKKMTRKYGKYPGIHPEHLEKCLDEDNIWYEDFTSVGFFADPLPELLPDENHQGYSHWAYTSSWIIPGYGYDVWDFIEKNPNKELNARNYDDTKPMWDKCEEIQEEITKFVKAKGFFHLFTCGGDWDDGSMDVILKPSDNFLRFVYANTNFPKWEIPKNNIY